MRVKELFSSTGIATLTLVLMSVQLLYIEGWSVSMVKVVYMCLTPFLIFIYSPHISKAVIYSLLFWVVTVAISFFQPVPPRMDTFYYSAMFLSTFCLYYNLVFFNEAFTLSSFLKLIKYLIWAYIIVLIAQQLLFVVGVRYFPLLNLMELPYYEGFKLNSLGIEPSHSARLLTIFFYAFLKLTEYKNGEPVSLVFLFKNYKWLAIAFIYAMMTMGSGTAFVGLAVLSLYFMRPRYAISIAVAAFAIYMIIPFLHIEGLDRAMNVFNAALTMDTQEVTKVDNSAGARVNILINTFNNLDITDPSMWTGYGVDQGAHATGGVVTGMSDYGLISYIFKMVLFFTCAFTTFFSLEIVMFVLLFSLNIGNIAYGWAALMVFATIKYFYEQKKYEELYSRQIGI